MDIAQLGLAVDSRPVATAATELDRLTAAGGKAEGAAQANTKAWSAASKSINNTTISAAQMSAALRGVPAQFTDIATSLASGQAPLTVFLQQGGQLKDMFGGAGAAAKALGGYVVGLVNPFTIAAATAAALAVAYYQGSAEADAYAKALITTGNAAGVTKGQMADMALAISGTVGTQGKAAESLAALAATGKVAGADLQKFATSTIQANRQLGISVEDSAKAYAELGKDPVAASRKLSDTMGYLTTATYAQIVAAKKLGDDELAASLAQNAYSNAMRDRAQQVEVNAGTMERAWKLVADAGKSAWDAMLGVGRTVTTGQKLATVQQQLADMRNEQAKGAGGAAYQAELRTQIALVETEAAALAGMAYQSEQAAKQQGEKTRAEAAGRNAIDAVTKITEQNASKQDQLNKALKDYRKNLDDIRATDPDNVLLKPATIAATEAGIRKHYAATKSTADAYAAARDAAKEWEKQLKDSEEGLSKATGKTDNLSEAERKLRDYLASSAYTINEKTNPAMNALMVSHRQAEIAAEQWNESLKGAAKAAEEAAKAASKINEEESKRIVGLREAKKAADAASLSVADEAEALSFEVGLIGKSTDARKLEIEQYRIKIALRKRLLEIENDPRYIGDETGAQEAARQQAREDAAKAGATAAARASFDVWQANADRIGADLTDALLAAGKDGGASLRKMIERELIQKPFRMVIEAMLNPVAGAMSSAITGAGGSAGGSMIGSLFGAGGLTGSMAAGAGWLTGATTLGGSLTAAGSLIGTGTMAGMASGAGMLAGALGPIALGIEVLSSLVEKSTPHLGAGATYSAAGGLNASAAGYTQAAYGFGAADEFTAVGAKLTGDIAKSVVTILDTTATAFGKSAGYQAATAFADDSSKDGAWGSLVIRRMGETVLDWADTQSSKWAPKVFSDAEKGSAEYLAAIAASTRDALVSMDLPGWATGYLDALGDAPTLEQLSGAVTQIAAAGVALEQMGRNLVGFSGLSESAVSALVQAAGGIDALSTNATAYYESYYSEAERAANVTRDVTEALSSVGLAMPASLAAFRAMVEQQQALGNTDAVAVLLGVNQAFAGIVSGGSAAAEVLADVSGLENELLGLLGETATQRRRELDALDPQSRALKSMVYAAQDAQAAISTLTDDIAGLDAIASQASDLGTRIGVLLGAPDATEANLWASVGNASASAADRLTAVGSLIDLITTRAASNASEAKAAIETANAAARTGYELQLSNAEKMVDVGRQLRSYVSGLQTGALSTLTPEQKMAQARSEYAATLARAAGGDTGAMGELQGVANTYLELARAFDPASYQDVFAGVSTTLSSFGGSLIDSGQAAANAARESLVWLEAIGNASTAQTEIDSASRTALETLAAIVTGIQSDAVIERASKQAQLTIENGRMDDIRQILRDTGVITESLPATMTANNDALIAEIRALADRLGTLEGTIITVGGQQINATVQSGAATASALSSGAWSTAIAPAMSI